MGFWGSKKPEQLTSTFSNEEESYEVGPTIVKVESSCGCGPAYRKLDPESVAVSADFERKIEEQANNEGNIDG